MPQPAQARAWWADVEDVRERIERRRARESQAPRAPGGPGGSASAVRAPATHRGVREVRPGKHLMVVRSGGPLLGGSAPGAPAPGGTTSVGLRRRPRQRIPQRLGPRPDRVAGWAVVLGFALVVAAILSAHG